MVGAHEPEGGGRGGRPMRQTDFDRYASDCDGQRRGRQAGVDVDQMAGGKARLLLSSFDGARMPYAEAAS
jgi:hypothetical protein